MSSEILVNGAEFEWFVTVGNILTTVIAVTVVIAAVFTLIRYLKKNVTAAVLQGTAKLENVQKDINQDRERVARELERNIERINEIKWMMQELAKRVDETKQELAKRVDETKADTFKRVDERVEDIKVMNRKLDVLREELYALKIEVVRKIDRSQTLTTAAQEDIQKVFNQADLQQKKAMDAIDKHIGSSSSSVATAAKEEEDK